MLIHSFQQECTNALLISVLAIYINESVHYISPTECIDIKFGKGTVAGLGKELRVKCNQKCIDKGNKKVFKKVHVEV